MVEARLFGAAEGHAGFRRTDWYLRHREAKSHRKRCSPLTNIVLAKVV